VLFRSVHRGGAYTSEIRDADGAIGAFRVNPDPDATGNIRIDRPETGKASLADFLASIAGETREEFQALIDDESDADLRGRENALRGLVRAFGAVADAATRAAENARAGDRSAADQRLEAAQNALQRLAELIEAASEDVPDPLQNAARNRIEQATKRADQARRSEKL
jgi:hypothetical protein